MPLDDFIIWVDSLVDDGLKKFPHSLRRCGFPPVFSDAEVMTLEIASEYLGYDQDKVAWAYFNRH